MPDDKKKYPKKPLSALLNEALQGTQLSPGGTVELDRPVTLASDKTVTLPLPRAADYPDKASYLTDLFADYESTQNEIINLLTGEIQVGGKRYRLLDDGTVQQYVSGQWVEQTSFPSEVAEQQKRLMQLSARADSLSRLIDDANKYPFPDPDSGGGGSFDPVASYLQIELAKSEEVQRQLDDWITRARTYYDLKRSEQIMDLEGERWNLERMAAMQQMPILPPGSMYGSGIYFSPPGYARLSNLFGKPESPPPDYYYGYAEALNSLGGGGLSSYMGSSDSTSEGSVLDQFGSLAPQTQREILAEYFNQDVDPSRGGDYYTADRVREELGRFGYSPLDYLRYGGVPFYAQGTVDIPQQSQQQQQQPSTTPAPPSQPQGGPGGTQPVPPVAPSPSSPPGISPTPPPPRVQEAPPGRPKLSSLMASGSNDKYIPEDAKAYIRAHQEATALSPDGRPPQLPPKPIRLSNGTIIPASIVSQIGQPRFPVPRLNIPMKRPDEEW